MKQIEEKFRLDDISGYLYFLNYDVVYGYPFEAFKEEEDGTLTPLTVVEFPDLPVTPNTFSVDYDRNLVYLSDNFTEGDKFLVRYYTNGRTNPFKLTKDIYLETLRIMKRLNHRIIDGLYFYNEPHDNQYVLRISRGSIAFNGIFITVDEYIVDFKKLPLPTVLDKYVCFLFYISRDTISSYFDLQRYSLKKIDVVSSYMYTDKLMAISEANTKLFGDMGYDPDTVIVIGYVLVKLLPDGRFEKWYMYRDEYRTI